MLQFKRLFVLLGLGDCIDFVCKDQQQQDVCLPSGYNSFAPPPDQTPIIVDVRPDFNVIHGFDLKENTVSFAIFLPAERRA